MSRTTPPTRDDRSLVASIAAGDREALAELYTRYQQSLYSYLLQLTPDHGLAEEMLQDTLVAAWKSAHSFDGRSTVLTWLIGIARRQAHNTLRQRKLPLADETELACMASSEPEPEAYLPQDLGMYPDLSAREFLDYVGILKGMNDRKTRQRRVEDLLEVVALRNVANRKLKTFSGGMKRRIRLAHARRQHGRQPGQGFLASATSRGEDTGQEQ
ncbi:MAG: sigma-70 family RNA polymerase sigma factor [Ktedonobacteraceae bacterium]